MKAALDLKLFADRLKDLKIEIEEISKILSDPKSSLRNRKSYANIIKKTILPFLDQASVVCQQSSKVLAPIPSLEYVHRTNEAKSKEKFRQLELKCDNMISAYLFMTMYLKVWDLRSVLEVVRWETNDKIE